MIVLPIAAAAAAGVIGTMDLEKDEAMLKKGSPPLSLSIPQMPNVRNIRLQCCTVLAL
jgi:hypothetical protein